MIITEEDYLEHFGVKGMKWGVHKKRSEPRNKNYTSYNRRNDSFKYGDRGVKRINRSMNKGKTYEQAAKHEQNRQRIVTLVASGITIMSSPQGRILLNYGLNKAVNKYAHSPIYMNYLKARYGKGYSWASPASEALKAIGNKIIVDTTIV